MPTFEIKHRITGALLYKSDGKNLRSVVAHAVQKKTTLVGADLLGANLGGANLSGASLLGANLRGANLGGAYLGGNADTIMLHVGDPRGYRPIAIKQTDGSWRIHAGCRWFTPEQGLKHWGAAYQGDKALGKIYCRAIREQLMPKPKRAAKKKAAVKKSRKG